MRDALGHATVAVTLDLYTHVVRSAQREAERITGASLFGSVQRKATKVMGTALFG
ncbi:MAG: hypothetical protein M3T56_13765 [Chloroflexota bacterium]|nr:hypothetical protein [Chloroflexota bacterium]